MRTRIDALAAEPHGDRTQVGELGLEHVAGPHRDHPVHRPGQHDVPAPQARRRSRPACWPARRRSGPGGRAPRRPRRCRSVRRCGRTARRAAADPAARPGWCARRARPARRRRCRRRCRRSGSASPRCGCRPPRWPGSDAADRGQRVLRASRRARSGRWPSRRPARPRPAGPPARPARVSSPSSTNMSCEQHAEGGLVHPEQLLGASRGQPDLAPADHRRRRRPAGHVVALDRVAVVDRELRPVVGERRRSGPLAPPPARARRPARRRRRSRHTHPSSIGVTSVPPARLAQGKP